MAVTEINQPSPVAATPYDGPGAAVSGDLLGEGGAFDRPEAPADESEVADAFDVHVLPVGPVVRFPNVDTAGEADLVVAVLRRFGGHAVPWVFAEKDGDGTDGRAKRTLQSLCEADEALARWAGEWGERADRPSVLLWFGHGVPGSMGPALLVPGAKERDGNGRVTPDLFAHYIFAEQRVRDTEEGHWAIVVIEACDSENFVIDVAAKFTSSRSPRACSLLLIATGKPAAQAYLGAFRATLEAYADCQTWRDEEFTLRDLQVYMKGAGHWAELVGSETSRELKLRLRDRVPLDGATTVAEQRRLQREFAHTTSPRAFPRAADVPGFLEVVPGFVGRTADLTAVADWCANPGTSPVLAVTGPPGTGKSALLGEILKRLREETSDTPGHARVGAVLRLTGSTPDDAVRQLAPLLGTDVSGAVTLSVSAGEGGTALGSVGSDTLGRPADDLLDQLRCRLTARTAAAAPSPILILADALDEARDPVRVASLLRELTDIPGVRLLIGTRTSPYDDGEAPGSSRVDLRAVLGATTGHARVLELGPDPAAAADYAAGNVRRILREHPVGDAEWQETVVRSVRDAVDQHVRAGSWQFLQASLVVQEIEQRPDVLASDAGARTALGRLLARDRTGLFRSAVARITDGLPTAGPFLRALAFGQGRGLPRADGIWAHAAAGIAGSPQPLDHRELSLFLSRAAAYVLLDGEDRRSVYRLAHRTYAELLRADSTPEQRQSMLTALLDLAAKQIADGQSLSPHLEARLAQYAADCGAAGWAALVLQPAVVDRLPPTALSALALTLDRSDGDATAADVPIEVLGTVASAHLIGESLPADRPGLRQLGGLRATGRLHPAGPHAAWDVCWGRVRTVPLHLQLGGTDGAVTALTAHSSASWLVTGSLDGTVTVWKPWQAHRPALLRRGCERPVSALGALGSMTGDDGPGLLAVSHDDGTLQLWDTTTDDPEPKTTTSAQTVRVVTALPDGTRRFAVAGEAGYLAILGPDGERPQLTHAISYGDVVGLAPVTGTGRQQWLAAAYRSGELALWDVSGAIPTLLTTVATRQVLAALTAVTDAAGTVRLVTATEDGHVRVSRPTERNGRVALEIAEGAVPPGAKNARDPVLAALPMPGGGEAAVLGDSSGILRVLDLGGGPGRPMCVGGAARTRAMAVLGGPHGGHVLVTAAERDARVHFWVPSAELSADAALIPESARLTGMRRHVLADGEEVLVLTEPSGSPTVAQGETNVRVLRARDGEDLTDRVPPGLLAADGTTEDDTGSTSAPSVVRALHPYRLRGWVGLLGEPYEGLWASAGREGVVALWRSAAAGSWEREPVRRIQLGARCLRLAALSGGRLAVATDDGIVVLAIRTIASGADDRGAEQAYV